ncbi:hypothetical protein GUF49_12810, partial [Xanthomonas citri pv. citri]|nr:hypothetical protein [Xanthomonas citri pv. citri]
EASKRSAQQRDWLVHALVIKLYAMRFASDASTQDTLLRVAEAKDVSLLQLRMERHLCFGRPASALELAAKLDNPEECALPMT